MRTEDLHINESTTDEGKERQLVLDTTSGEEVIGLVCTDERIPDFTIGFALQKKCTLRSLLKDWLTSVLPDYGITKDMTVKLEYWIEENCYAEDVSADITPEKIRRTINAQKMNAKDKLRLVLLNADRKYIEVSVDENEQPAECVCTLPEMRLKSFPSFFNKHHRNKHVRSDSDISLKAFRDSPGSLNVVAPVSVIDQ